MFYWCFLSEHLNDFTKKQEGFLGSINCKMSPGKKENTHCLHTNFSKQRVTFALKAKEVSGWSESVLTDSLTTTGPLKSRRGLWRDYSVSLGARMAVDVKWQFRLTDLDWNLKEPLMTKCTLTVTNLKCSRYHQPGEVTTTGPSAHYEAPGAKHY